MLKHRKIMAILLSLMMVLCLTPTIAFADDIKVSITSTNLKDGKIEVAKGTSEALTVAGTELPKNYHVHWVVSGKDTSRVIETKAKKLNIQLDDVYQGNRQTITAYVYRDVCTTVSNDVYWTDSVENLPSTETLIGTTSSVTFKSVDAPASGDFNPLGIKLSGYGEIKEGTVVPVDRWAPTLLTASVDKDTDYTFKWTKSDGKEAVNFIDSSGNELSNIDKAGESITGNPIKLKGLVIREGKIKVEALDKDENTKGSAVFTVRVTSNMKYGQQGYAVSNDPQTIEIVRIGDKIVTDADIDGTKGLNNPGDIFKNAITNPFVLDKDTEISFFIGKGMGAKFTDSDLETFISDAMPCIKILDKDGKKIEDLNNLNTEFVSRNTDRSITVKLPTGQLKEGEYLLRFTEELAAGGQALGGNVDFSFTVAKPVADQPSDSPAEQPGNGQGADNKAEADSDTAETGDNMNIALYAGIMILALCGGAAVFARRRKEQ